MKAQTATHTPAIFLAIAYVDMTMSFRLASWAPPQSLERHCNIIVECQCHSHRSKHNVFNVLRSDEFR
jgi:hypothetical protein